MAAMAEEEYEDEEYEEISDEEKLKIATHFLLSSPAGEIKELVNDVKNIIPSSVLNEDSIKSIFRTHNIDQQTLGETTNGDVMLVSKHGEIDDNHYVDPRAGKIYGYNHVTQSWEVSDERSADINDSVEEQRASVQSAMDDYISTQYKASADAKAACAVYSTSEGNLVVCLTGVATNLRNWWSGSWKGEYMITLSGSSCSITGQVDLLAHYFEDGNVQMNTQKKYNADDVSFSGDAIVAQIQEWENALQASLETMYTGMSNQTFKDMRRILPVTYTKFDWSGQQMKMAMGSGTGTL